MAAEESRNRQNLFQFGKYSVNIGDGKDVHIGDRIFTDSKSIESIDWEKVSFARYLTNLQQLFTNHIHKGVERSTEENTNPYVSLKLQEIESTRSSSTSDIKVKTGTWQELIQLSGTYFISGDSGGGKTTLLLNIAKELAVKAIKDQTAPIPIYLPLNRFRSEDSSVLLSMAASTSGQETRILHGLWRDKHQPLWILLDGADEISHSYIQSFIDNLNNLLSLAGTERHTLILTTRPGLVLDQLKSNLHTPYQDLIILPLDNEQVDEFLHCYSATALADVLKLDNYLQTVIRNPGPLAAIAVSIQSIQQLGLPKNAGQIYKLLIDYHLAKRDNQQYDYWRVKRPVLANLAFIAFKEDRSNLVVSDDLYDQIAKQMEAIYHCHNYKRRVMPVEWTVQELFEELMGEEIISFVPLEDGRESLILFNQRVYLEYFVAVYFEDFDYGSSNLKSVIEDINIENLEKWINPLIFLVGLKKESINLFDRILSCDLRRAADFWLKKKPYGICAPSCISTEFITQLTEFDSLRLTTHEEPFTNQLLASLLNSNSPFNRLRTVGALSQWGLSSVDLLIDASEDSSPIIQAVSQYALLHLGEPMLFSETERPLPPLIRAERNQFQYQCYGGCSLHTGTLHLETPKNIRTHLAVNISHLDFNIFKENTKFQLWYTSPAWLGYSSFTTKNIDWLGLAARCNWISKQSARIAEKLKLRPLLSALEVEMRLRAIDYSVFGQCLAKDLGISWEHPESLEIPEEFEADSRLIYQEFQSLFNHINRSKVIRATDEEKQHDLRVETSMSIENLIGSSTNGIYIERIKRTRIEQSELTRFVTVNGASNIEKAENSNLTGIYIERLQGDASSWPPIFHIDYDFNIQDLNHSTVRGLLIEEFNGSGFGIQTKFTFNINRFDKSHLSAITIENYSESNEKETELSAETESLEADIDQASI